MVIARLYESELDSADSQMPSNLARVLYEECLGCCGATGEDYDVNSAHPDPFVRSMAYWMLKDYSAALGTLMETNVGAVRKMQDREKRKAVTGDADADAYSTNPSVFNFYNYLRAHPLLVRQQIATAADKSKTVLLSGFTKGGGAASNTDNKNVTYVDCITPVERTLYFATAHSHFKSGCPMLALEVLSKLPNLIDFESNVTKTHSSDNMSSNVQVNTGRLEEDSGSKKSSEMDWSQPVSSKPTPADSTDWSKPVSSSGGMDWSQPVSSSAMDWSQPVSKFEDDELKLDWGDDNDNEDDDDDDDKNTKSDNETESKDKALDTEVEESVNSKSGGGGKEVRDIMAQQLKFMACLKIMMEELATLATGFEVDGGQLRFQLFIWLEKEVEVLKKLTSYGHDTADHHHHHQSHTSTTANRKSEYYKTCNVVSD